jgi:hypothetical protein
MANLCDNQLGVVHFSCLTSIPDLLAKLSFITHSTSHTLRSGKDRSDGGNGNGKLKITDCKVVIWMPEKGSSSGVWSGQSG